ncbi:hypothetical protein, partial [Parasutterella excrementihominis]|uniref:hypothetical protein n=1 Tax=Parasutterella excrementihominis TaxID=487175 RepID=UPI003A8FA8E2
QSDLSVNPNDRIRREIRRHIDPPLFFTWPTEHFCKSFDLGKSLISLNFLPMILPVLCDYLDVNPNLSKKTNSFLRREETIDIEDLKKEKSSFLKFILECDFLAARW